MVIRMPMSVEDVARWMAGATGTPDERFRQIHKLLTTLLTEERSTMASLLEQFGVFVKSMEDPFNDEDYSWLTRKLRNWADIVREHGPDHVVMDERIVCRDAPPEDVLPGEEHKREDEAERKKAAQQEAERLERERVAPIIAAAKAAQARAYAEATAAGHSEYDASNHATRVYQAVYTGDPPPALPAPKKKAEPKPRGSQQEPGRKPRVSAPPPTPTTTATAAPAANAEPASPGAPASPTLRPRRPPATTTAGQLALEPVATPDADHNGDGSGGA